MLCTPDAQIRISARADEAEGRAILRVSSPALIACDALQVAIEERYGRVLEGLSRQLRSQLHHEEMSGAFEISIATLGRDSESPRRRPIQTGRSKAPDQQTTHRGETRNGANGRAAER